VAAKSEGEKNTWKT